MNNLPYGQSRWTNCKQRSQWWKLGRWTTDLHMWMLFKPQTCSISKCYSNQTSMYLCNQHTPTIHILPLKISWTWTTSTLVLLPPTTLWTWTTSTLVLIPQWRQHPHHRALSLFKTPGSLIIRETIKKKAWFNKSSTILLPHHHHQWVSIFVFFC